MKIAVAHFIHETVTFLKNDTTREDFLYDGSPLAGEALLQSGGTGYISGFVKVAREYPDVELIGITSPMFPKTGTGSAWITADAYEYFMGRMLEDLAAAGPVDGVYLALHGAMAVRGVARPEADIARRVRAVAGPKAFVAGTFDPHGNEDEAFFEAADFAFCAKYFPHYDEYLQGNRAASALVRAIRGDYRPVQATCKVPILTPTVAQWTGMAPWSELVQRALVWEARSPDLYVNVFFGFPWSDVVDGGMTVQAMANGDPALAERAVKDIADFAWRVRKDLVSTAKPASVRDGMARAGQLAESGTVVVGDHSDRSGRATWILSEVIAQDLSRTLIGTVADPTLAQRLAAIGAKPGDAFDMDVGGGSEDSDGPPVRVTGRILKSVRTGPGDAAGSSPWIFIGFGRGNVLVVSPYLTQITEREVFTDFLGLDLAQFRIIVLKSRVHFRRGFVDSGFADHVLIVEPGQSFLGTTRLEGLPYEHLRLADYYPYGREMFQPVVIASRSRR